MTIMKNYSGDSAEHSFKHNNYGVEVWSSDLFFTRVLHVFVRKESESDFDFSFSLVIYFVFSGLCENLNMPLK